MPGREQDRVWPPRLARLRRAAAAGLTAGSLVLLAGCASGGDPLAEAAAKETGYVAGDGSSVSLPPAERTAPVKFSGADEDGNTLDQSAFRGKVTVVNFWYAGCAPCRAEAKDLNANYAEFSGQNVAFLGVNTRDQAAQAKQFSQQFKVQYPSIVDTATGRAVQSAFAGAIPLNAVPTTLVLDTEGRVAHRVLGQLASASQLSTMIRETLAESAE